MRILLLLPILLTLPSLSDTYIHNSVITNSNIGSNIITRESSGILSTKNIVLKGEFDKINVEVPANVRIKHSSQKSITLKMEKDFINNVSFQVSNGILNISTKDNINSALQIDITLNTESLNRLKVSTTANVTVEGFNSKSFELYTYGTSKVTFLSGSIENFSLKSKGTSKIDLEQIHVKRAKIVSEGTSRTKIDVSDDLTVRLSGISKVKYSGEPKVTQNISGLGKLIKTR